MREPYASWKAFFVGYPASTIWLRSGIEALAERSRVGRTESKPTFLRRRSHGYVKMDVLCYICEVYKKLKDFKTSKMVISNFKWFNNVGDIVCFDPADYNFTSDFYYNHKKNEFNLMGVSWLYGDKLIEIKNVWHLSTLPLPEMDRVFVTLRNNGNFEYYIYNADGSVSKKIRCPERRYPYDGDCSIIYEVCWLDPSEGDYTMLVNLQGKCDPFWEDRLFNPTLCEFGRVKSSGRR